MSTVLTHNAYGKSQVRLTRVTRLGDRHDLKELCVSIQLEGDFAGSGLHGDNSRIVATDTMKNTVYILAKKEGVAAPETFGEALARHFLHTYSQVTSAAIQLVEQPWQRMAVDGREQPHAFIGSGGEKRTCTVTLTRQGLRIESGFENLPLLKTTDSAFAGFIHDEYTTLRDTDDRIFATLLTANWIHGEMPADWDASYQAMLRALLAVFASHKSLAVQQTMNAMAVAALESCPFHRANHVADAEPASHPATITRRSVWNTKTLCS